MPAVDLALHHFPCSTAAENKAVWSGLLEAKKIGLARAVGVSNYARKDLAALLAGGGEVPAVNQCLMSIGSHDDATIAFCKAHKITYESYSPLRHVDLSDKRIKPIASAHNVSTAQVVRMAAAPPPPLPFHCSHFTC
jgi:diketogulonate reductase-like aldo/keto reductase